MRTETDWSIPQRQGGSALLIIIFKTLFSLLKNIWPLAIAILFTGKGNRSDRLEWFLLIFFALAMIRSLIEFYFFRFQIVNNELVIRKGFFTRQTIVLPLDKIIAVHIEQNWLHRLFGAAQVSFDSAGSNKTEVIIKALQTDKAQQLQQFITESRPAVDDVDMEMTKPEINPIISLTASDLFKLSVSANHIEAFFLLLVFGLTIIENISEATGQEASGLLSWLYDSMDTDTISGILFLAAAVLFISLFVSFARVLLQYANFRIIRSEKGFSIRNGLINTKEKLVPFRKIQYISWKANWVRKKMGVFLLHFHAAGTQGIKEKMQVKVPVTQKNYIDVIVKDYHELLPVTALHPVRIHNAYIGRSMLLKGILPALLLGSIAWFAISWYAVLLLLLIPFAALTSWLFCKKFNLWQVPEALQINKGTFGSETAILNWNKIQCIQLNQSIYQRRKNLATLKIFTAGGTLSIPFITMKEATRFYNYALFKIESETTGWM